MNTDVKIGQVLVEYNGSIYDFLLALDQIWLGRSRQLPPENAHWWRTDQPLFEVEKRIEQLAETAPKGHFFGPHIDNPTCYGYWPNI